MRLEDTHFQPPGGAWTDGNWPAHRDAMRAARERCMDYTRLYTRRGYAAHLSPPSGLRGVLCAVLPMWPGDWLGTGSQAEYELAAELPTCKRCYALFMSSCRCGNPECSCRSGFLAGLVAAGTAGTGGPPP